MPYEPKAQFRLKHQHLACNESSHPRAWLNRLGFRRSAQDIGRLTVAFWNKFRCREYLNQTYRNNYWTVRAVDLKFRIFSLGYMDFVTPVNDQETKNTLQLPHSICLSLVGMRGLQDRSQIVLCQLPNRVYSRKICANKIWRGVSSHLSSFIGRTPVTSRFRHTAFRTWKI